MRPDHTSWPPEFAERYRALGYWTGETFDRFLPERARRFADLPAVVADGHRWTYAELARRAEHLAAGLAGLGIGPGDRVVVQVPNRPELLEAVFALFRMGALPVFALPAHRSEEVSYLCSFTGAAALVIADTHAGFDYRTMAGRVRARCPRLRHVIVCGRAGHDQVPLDRLRRSGPDPAPRAAPDSGGVAFLQLSGGTTGRPKLIPRTHDDYLYSVRASARICELSTSTVYLGALPLTHNFPMSSPGFLGVLHSGGTVVLAPDLGPGTCMELIESEHVTHTALVPPLAMLWLDAVEGGSQAGRDLSSLRVLQVGGARLAPEAAARVRPVLGCELQQVFGMAEGLVCYTRPGDPDDVVLNTQGRPISPHDEIRVVDEDGAQVPDGHTGELLTRGPYTIRGYHAAPEHNARAFTPEGFYRTGDLVRRSAGGYLTVRGRVKDQVNRGGEKVAPEEVENHVLAHPGVLDAALIGVPDAYLGERTCVYVVPRGQAPSAGELRAFLRERGLAAYKIPDLVEFTAEFPVTGVGKISRRELRALLAAGHPGAASATT